MLVLAVSGGGGGGGDGGGGSDVAVAHLLSFFVEVLKLFVTTQQFHIAIIPGTSYAVA